jgi:DNA recombination protein RmuC
MGTQQEQKNEVEKLQDKFTKEFENLANKILEEKSNKFTEQNKENMKSILSPLQEKIHLFEKKSRRYAQKHRLPCSFAPTDSRFTRMNVQMSKETINLTRALKEIVNAR